MRRQDGFTLIELLVVILIIGILSAVAVPSFLGQRDKANDTAAIQEALSARKAMETFRTQGDDYQATRAELVAIEATLAEADGEGRLIANGNGTAGYQVGVKARATGTTFTFQQTAGQTTRTCDRPGRGKCRANSSW